MNEYGLDEKLCRKIGERLAAEMTAQSKDNKNYGPAFIYVCAQLVAQSWISIGKCNSEEFGEFMRDIFNKCDESHSLPDFAPVTQKVESFRTSVKFNLEIDKRTAKKCKQVLSKDRKARNNRRLYQELIQKKEEAFLNGLNLTDSEKAKIIAKLAHLAIEEG